MASYAPWRPYNTKDVMYNVPSVGGVYLFRVQLKNGNHIVFYVGQSKNLSERLLAHLRDSEPNACIKNHVDNHIVSYTWVQIDRQADRDYEEAAKIREYNPECNIQKPNP